MSALEANKTIIVIGRETTYGTAFTTPTVKIPDMMEYTFGVAGIDVPQKTQTLEPKIKTSQEGRKSPTVTLSGILTDEHEEFLVAFFGDTASPYVWGTSDVAADAAGHSYTICQAIPAASDDLGDGVQATGCRLESFEINRNGDYIGYTATFRAKTIDDMVDFSTYTLTGITDTSYPELISFLWQNVTCSLLDTVALTSMNTFGLSLTNTFMDDDPAFQNSQTKGRDYICSSGGQLTAEWIYDTVSDATVYDNLFKQTTQTDVVSIINANKTWTFTTEGQYQEYSKPDKESCLFTGSFTKQLLGDASNTALSIAVS
jgi:hypothetical protein